MSRHVHQRSRLSTPHCSICECGAVQIGRDDYWLEGTWEPPPLPPPPPPRRTAPTVYERPTARLLPLVSEALARGGWDVGR